MRTFNTQVFLYSVLASAFQFLLNLTHHEGKLQVDDDDLVKLKVLYKSTVSHFFFIYLLKFFYFVGNMLFYTYIKLKNTFLFFNNFFNMLQNLLQCVTHNESCCKISK